MVTTELEYGGQAGFSLANVFNIVWFACFADCYGHEV